MSREDAERELASRDWSGVKVDDSPSTAMVTLAARFRPDLADRIMAEAEERGVRPSVALRDLVAEAFAARDAAADEPVTVRRSDVLRALSESAMRDRPAA